MRRHTAAPRAGFFSLLTLLAAAPTFGGDGLASPAAPGPGSEEGVVSLSDRTARVTKTADAAVTPAGLLAGCHAEPGCEAPCDAPAVCPSCDGGCGVATACDGGCCDGACGNACCEGGACGNGSCGSGSCLGGFGLCCPACGSRCGPLGVCRTCGVAGVPCRTMRGGRGLVLPGLPGACLPGAPCLPGLGLLGRGIPYWTPDGGPEACYLASLLGIGANACNGRHGLLGTYNHVYAVNPGYSDRREGQVWAAAGTGVPTAVPLAPNVRHTMEYGWGLPSSRLVPISRPAPPSYLYGPPAGTDVELPRTRKGRVQGLPIIPELGQGGFHDHRTGVGFERHGSVDHQL